MIDTRLVITLSLLAAAPLRGDVVTCPPDGTPENEPCGSDTGGADDFNAGCTTGGPGPPPDPMMPMSCGQTYCGEAYFDGAFRDTDWMELLWEGDPGVITFRAIASFDLVIARPVRAGPFNPDCEFFDACFELVPAGVEARLRHRAAATPGGAWYLLAPQFTDVFDCEPSGVTWTATAQCAPLGPCTADVDGTPGVAFGDLIAVLAQWGGEHCRPANLDGDGEVGLGDLLLVLTHWGPCA